MSTELCPTEKSSDSLIEAEAFVTCRLAKDYHASIKIIASLQQQQLSVNIDSSTSTTSTIRLEIACISSSSSGTEDAAISLFSFMSQFSVAAIGGQGEDVITGSAGSIQQFRIVREEVLVFEVRVWYSYYHMNISHFFFT